MRIPLPRAFNVLYFASFAGLTVSSDAVAQPIGNPTAANGWSTTSAVQVHSHSGEAPGREISHLIDGSGMSGTNGQYADLAAGPSGNAYFGMSRTGGTGASPSNPGTLQSSASHWFELQFDQVYTLNDVAIWNDNQQTYDQGWKHLAIQVSTTGGNTVADWTTVFNGILPQSPGDGVSANHFGPTLPAAVLTLGGVQAKYVSFTNLGLGDESSYFKQYNNLSDPLNADLSEVRFNSGLTAGMPIQRFNAVGSFNPGKIAFVDYDNDGQLDLATDGQLYRNNGGNFTAGPLLTGAATWADYDKDSDIDAFDYTNQKLYRNNGNSTFTEMPMPAIGPMVSRGAAWGDFNRDRRLDLYVGGFEADDLSRYYPDRILTSNSNGTFSVTWTEPVNTQTSPGSPRPGRGVTAADWDRDGDLDVYVSNYRLEPNALMRNDGQGNFTDVAATHNALATSPGFYGGHSIGSVWGDFNNDGYLDLFAGNFAHAGQPESRFLKNRGPAADYAFQDKGTGGVFYQESYGTPAAGDIDNDGDLDLFFTTIYGGDNPILFRNDGNFKFTDVTTAWGLPKNGMPTYQAAFADYDDDGQLDLFADGKLYRNSGNSNHWVKVKLNGSGLFDAAVTGAQVFVTARPRHSGAAVGNPSAGNGWNTTSAVSIVRHSGERDSGSGGAGREVINLINGSGMSGASGELHANGTPAGKIAMFARPPVGGGSSAANAGTSQASGSHWFELDLGSTVTLNDIAIWNYNEPAWFTQGWKHVKIEIAQTDSTNPSDWTTVYDGELPLAPGEGSEASRASLVIPIPSLSARFVSFTNTGLGDEATWLAGDDGSHAGLGEVRFNSGLPVLTLVRQVESSTGEGNQNDSTLHFGLGEFTGPLEVEIHWPGGGMIQKTTLPEVDETYDFSSPRAGDADIDGDIDLNDLSVLAANYARVSGGTWNSGDFDFDGDVDLNDLSVLAANYGTGQAQAFADFQAIVAAPEPSSLVLAALAMAAAVRRPKRSTFGYSSET